jgi:hypothetical protein
MLRFEQRDKVADLISEAELPIDLNRNGRDDFFKSPYLPQQFHTVILVNRHILVQAALEINGFTPISMPKIGLWRVIRI